MIQLTVAIFAVAYFFIATEKLNRITVVSFGAAAMIITGAVGADEIFFSHETGIDWNVLFLLLGMMIIVGVIHKTGLFEYLAIKSIHLAKAQPRRVYIYILLLVAFASALLDNVTTVMLAVPMTFLLTKYLNVKAMPFILGEIFISNIGGAATLIGDPPNIIIASKAGLSFNSFLANLAPIVLVVMAVVIPFLVFVFRRDLANTQADRDSALKLEPKSFITDAELLKKSLTVLSVVILAFVTHSLTHIEPSLIAMLGAGSLIYIAKLKVDDYVNDVEWETILFFAGLFIMVGALVEVGALNKVATFLADAVGNNGQLAAGILILFSALLSGIVDNIPYVTSMAPVVAQLNESIPSISNDGLWWALALGADFGGNMTIVGASANVVALGIAAAQGERISFMGFLKYGLPVTILSIAVALPYVLIRYF